MKRRTFLKIAAGVSLAGVVPAIVAKDKVPDLIDETVFHFKPHHQNTDASSIHINDLGEKPIVRVNGSRIKEYNGEYKIVAKDKFSKPMLNEWSNMVGIRREPFETDVHLRKRILSKLRN